MKIISWNVNGIRSLLGQNSSKSYNLISNDNRLFEYIDREQPDILCLQETKAEPDQIREDLRYPPGYYGYYSYSRARKGYSGAVTFTKVKPINYCSDLGEERFDREGRVICTEYNDFSLYNVYFPNGTSGRERVDYKLEFYDFLFDYIEKFRVSGKPVIVCGDYNTAHYAIDLARPEENKDTSGFLPEERVKLDEIVARGYVDTFRWFNKEPNQYTWWSNRARARENNVGWRIDYHFVTENLIGAVSNSYHQPDVLGSDHCPIVLELNV